MTRLLAIADETTSALSASRIRDIAPDLVLSCGDLPFDYIDYVASAANVPYAYVPGNHDPSLKREPHPYGPGAGLRFEEKDDPGPPGGMNLDGRIIEEQGLTLAGLGGSIRYNSGENQYTDGEMRFRAARLEAKWWLRRFRGRGVVHVLVTHSPPRDLGDMPDPAHRGFAAFPGLVARIKPQVLLHGHVHPHGFDKPDRMFHRTTIINVVPYRVVEVTP